MIHIDGSYMEGGGQILRKALALSTLTRKPFIADKIRHNRPKPGLKNQHLTCIKALKRLAKAQVNGARLGSASIEFFPGNLLFGTFSIDIGTAGSITLLLQSLLLPAIFADDRVRLKLTGGTDTKWSIPIDYFSRVILPFFNQFALVEIKRTKRGFYPKGRGFVELLINPRFRLNDFIEFYEFNSRLRSKVQAFHLLEKAKVVKIQGISSASLKLKRDNVAERQIEGAAHKLGHLCPVEIEKEYCDTASNGTVITLWTVDKNQNVFMGADALGERGKRAEAVGAEAAGKLLGVIKSDAAVDHHLADNLMPLLALAGGRIKTNKITGHIRSNIYVCEKFLDVHFDIDEKRNEIFAK
jgi:RNA 3'-phosphate cyclase